MLASFTAEENVHVSKNLITTVKLYGFIGNELIALAKDSHSTGSLTLFNIVPFPFEFFRAHQNETSCTLG